MKLFNAVAAIAILGALGACSFSPKLSNKTLEGEWSYKCELDSGEEIMYTISPNGGNSSEVIFGPGSRRGPKFQTTITSNQIELTSSDGKVNVHIDRALEDKPEKIDRDSNYSLGGPVPFSRINSGFKTYGICQLKWWDNAKTLKSREKLQSEEERMQRVNIIFCENRLKSMLKDPGSYQRIEVYPSSYHVKFKYRAKNGFGGYGIEEWTCDTL